MKNTYSKHILAFILGGIFVLGICIIPQYLRKTSDNNVISSNSPYKLCTSFDDACIEKINAKNTFSNDITAMSYKIESIPGEETGIVINYPAFSDRTLEEKQSIFKKMRESGATKLTLGFASSNIFAEDMGDIEILVSQSSFDELHIRLYSKPLNIIELFDLIKWKASPKMKIILEFINLDLPLDINLYEYLYLSEKMVKRNNGIMPLASFSIIFNPLFYKFDPIDSYIMEPDKYKRLSQFPTKKLFIGGIGDTYAKTVYSNSENGRGRILNFLESSPIGTIQIEGIGSKEDGKIQFQ